MGHHPALVDIDRQNDLVGVILGRRLDKIGLVQRRGADHHPPHPHVEQMLDPLARAHAAAHLQGRLGGTDQRLQQRILRRPASDGVEIGHMDPLGPGMGKAAHAVARIDMPDLRLLEPPAIETDRVAVLKFDGRN